MTKVKIQIKGTKENGTSRTHKEICEALNKIASETECVFSFEGLHPQNESNPFIWVDYSGSKVYKFVNLLDAVGLYQRNCSFTAGIPGIDSLPT